MIPDPQALERFRRSRERLHLEFAAELRRCVASDHLRTDLVDLAREGRAVVSKIDDGFRVRVGWKVYEAGPGGFRRVF
jgi:hypothetical protein